MKPSFVKGMITAIYRFKFLFCFPASALLYFSATDAKRKRVFKQWKTVAIIHDLYTQVELN